MDLYGSLSLTAKGNATDYAIMLGLSGTNPKTIPVDSINDIVLKQKTLTPFKIK